MSLYDDSNPQHLEYLERARRRWTPEKEAKLQAEVQAMRQSALNKGGR